MKYYLGVFILEAQPMTKGEAFTKGYFQGYIINGESEAKGYVILFNNGNTTWIDKESFESSYFPIISDNCITEKDVENFISKEECCLNNKFSSIIHSTKTNFKITTNFIPTNSDSKDTNKMLAIRNNKDKIKEYLNFVLQWALNGLKY